MKNNIHLLLLSILVISATACAPLFHDDFEADQVGQLPNAAPAGDPEGDALEFSANPGNNIMVINAENDFGKAVKITRGGNDVYFDCVPEGGPFGNRAYTLTYDAYSTQLTQAVVKTQILSDEDAPLIEILMSNGNISVNSANGLEQLDGNYAANQKMTFAIILDMSQEIYYLVINGENNVNIGSTNGGILNPDANFAKLRFSTVGSVLEAFEVDLIVDNIKMVTGKED